MRLPSLDARDRLVILAATGLGAMVNGVAMFSSGLAWITAGMALMLWAVWRLR